MFKKTVLGSVLLVIVFASLAAAADIVASPGSGQEAAQISQVSIQPLQPTDLLVDLEVKTPLSGLKKNDLLWVDIYLTPIVTYKYIGDTKIQLSISNLSAATFTGLGENGELFVGASPAYAAGAYFLDVSNVLLGDPVIVYPVTPGRKYLLGKLQVKVLASGTSFAVTVDKAQSSALYNKPNTAEAIVENGQLTGTKPIAVHPSSPVYYTVKPGSTKEYSLASSFCVPLAACPPDTCGPISNGCGGLVSCSTVCVSQVLPQNSFDYDKTVLQLFSDALKSQGNKYQKLAAIITAVKLWFNNPSNQ